jgi:hypothetical protein
MKIESRWTWRAMLAPATLLSALLLLPCVAAHAEQPMARTAAVTDTANMVKATSDTRLAVAGITPEVACEAGSLRDCEELYCRNGISEECRQRVLQTAKISTDTWYLREQGPVKADGTKTYGIRCMTQPRPLHDITIICAAAAGPHRCSAAPKSANSGYARLDKAATGYCTASGS